MNEGWNENMKQLKWLFGGCKPPSTSQVARNVTIWRAMELINGKKSVCAQQCHNETECHFIISSNHTFVLCFVTISRLLPKLWSQWLLTTKIQTLESRWHCVPNLKKFPDSVPAILREWDGQAQNILPQAKGCRRDGGRKRLQGKCNTRM